jgi:glycosyltransferase involved in cell wall biosynthesis
LLPFSRWAAQSLHDDYGIAWDRIVVSQPGLGLAGTDAPEQLQEAVDLSNAHPRPPGAPLVRSLFIGSPGPAKGLNRLLAWHQACFADEMELTVVSATKIDASVLRNVRYLGRVEHRSVMEMLPSFDFLVHPTFIDCSPWVLVESALAGVPAIVSRTGAISEMVENGVTGILCDVDDDDGFRQAIRRLIDDQLLRESMGRAARSRALARASVAPFGARLRDALLSLLCQPHIAVEPASGPGPAYPCAG